MKIVVVIDLYDLLTNGTVMACYRFVDELKKKGHTVRVVATGAKGEDCYEVPERYIPLVTEVSKLQQIRFGKPDTEILTNAFTGADLVHFYMPFKLEKKGRKIAQKMGIPTTAAFHVPPEAITYNAGIKYSKLVPKILYAGFRNRFYKYFDHVHCPSNFVAQRLLNHKYKSKMHVISNGVDRDFIPPKEYKQMDPNHINIMMVGRYAPEKRQDVIIKACGLSKYADKIYLTLAGKGPNKAKYERLCDKYLKNPCTFEFFNKEELIEQMHNTDLYIHASDIETEALACIEAFACGVVPIISNSSKSATPQFAIDDRSLFERANAQDLADKIDYWIEHPEEKEEMSSKYVELSKRYSIDYSIEKFEEMFKEAIATEADKKRLATKEAKKKSKHYVKKGKLFRFFSWFMYYIIAAPIIFIYTRCFLGLRVKGKKNLKKVKKKGAVSVSNHVHLLDCAMNAVAMFPRKVVFTALESNFKIPVGGVFLKWLGAVPVPENISDMRIFMNEVGKLLKDNRIVHVYSEAHLINYYAGLRQFNRGAFKIACQNQVPILPIVISWRKRTKLYRLFFPSKPCATITIGKPVYPNLLMFKREMEKDLETRTVKYMNKLYEDSNYGMNVDFWEGKGTPTEFKKMADLSETTEQQEAIKKEEETPSTNIVQKEKEGFLKHLFGKLRHKGREIEVERGDQDEAASAELDKILINDNETTEENEIEKVHNEDSTVVIETEVVEIDSKDSLDEDNIVDVEVKENSDNEDLTEKKN